VTRWAWGFATMFQRAIDFRKTLDSTADNATANYLFMGDLNTMGMLYPFKKNIDALIELQKLDAGAKKRKMRRLAKTQEMSWWNGPAGSMQPSNLDHVVAADHLKFKKFGANAQIDVRGWASLSSDAEKQEWIKLYSDHSLMFFQLEK
jgi:hypothetical protein